MLIFLSLIAIISCFEPGHQKETYIFTKFKEFMIKYNKTYSTIEEFNQRFLTFKANYIEAEEFTLTANTTYSKGITKFSDLTKEEFKRTYLGFKPLKKEKREHVQNLTFIDKALPETLNWTTKGAVTPVKDQGGCGSCWAFSSVGNLEGLNFIKNGDLVSFSEQEIVSCDIYDQGCGGGWMETAFKWLTENDGIVDEESYPYSSRGGDSGVCDIPKSPRLLLNGSKFIGSTVAEIKEALNEIGPLSVTLNADSLMSYTGGIINDDASKCDPTQLNHAVTLVGWGVNGNDGYWIVKNSWSASWGEQGYFRLLITDDGKGICGINTHIVTAILK